ncbi:MAG: MerR family transcriptional regulator [Bacteroidales bacterium]|nr:MerR family transcriptional regulator [Bacteroidales bacterium]
MEEKLYYSIKEVSEKFNIPYSTLRYWEEEFPKFRIHRNQRGVRMYNKSNIEMLEKIVYLTRERKMTIEGAKLALRTKEDMEEDSLATIKNSLLEAKEFLTELKAKLTE